MHILDFDISSELNTRAFKLTDMSVYDNNLDISNGIIEVVAPGFSYAEIFRVNKDFELVLNSNLLHLNPSFQSNIPNLPDGLYKIKYSVSPNAEVNILYHYFRTTLLECKYLKSLDRLWCNKKKFSQEEYNNRQSKLFEMKEYILGAKYLAEDVLDCKGAQDMYDEINSELTNFELCH